MKNSFILKALFGVLLLLMISFPSYIAAANTENDGFEEMDGNDQTADTAKASSEDDWFAETDSTTSPQEKIVTESSDNHSTVYPLVSITSTILILYLITWLLSKSGKMKIATHRKIWNSVLLISFLVSGIMGLVLVVQVNYDVLGSFYSTFMWLHVDFGIVMALTSIFHILWHTKYFSKIIKK